MMQRIEIHFKGQINPKWQAWFGDLQITPYLLEETVLSGIVADQAALYGVISHLRDLGLELISVTIAEVEREHPEL